MDPYDKEKTRQIWKRVLGEEEGCGCRAFDSELLREMITAEKTAVCDYRALACRASAPCRERLLRYAEQTLCRVGQLEAVFFLWTGERACAMSGQTTVFRCLSEGLRELYRRESRQAERLRRTAEELPDYRQVFLSAAEEKTRRAEGLLCLLQRCLSAM